MSDPGGILATPLLVIDRKGNTRDIEIIDGLIRQHKIGLVVVGLPWSMAGKIGEQAEKVKAFVRTLTSQTDIPVEFRDERLSTVSARRLSREGVAGRSKKMARDDAAAAAVILQSYLEEYRDSTDG
jgi:putative Holliday junction resolvase